jgi:DNA-binding response OmpR family regulator
VYSDSLLAVDVERRKVVVAGHEIDLDEREFELLAALVESPGELVACDADVAQSLRRKVDEAGTGVMALESADGACRYMPPLAY